MAEEVKETTEVEDKGKVPPGWKGGFLKEHPKFNYPNPNLSSLKFQGNLDNIPKLTRQQKVLWPEFSWQTTIGDDSTRLYQMFAPNISRLGYDDKGQVWSIICPQQGAYIKDFGSFNVEVTVTGNRGWVDEPDKELYADMSVVGTIWFADNPDKPTKFQDLKDLVELLMPGYNFPLSKENAIKVYTHLPGNPNQAPFPLKKGESGNFKHPEFTRHWEDGAWNVANLEVEIGGIMYDNEKKTPQLVKDFNQFVLNLFNFAKGNILQKGGILTWNVWFTDPELVDQEEWSTHAERWRHSIDTDHGSPDGPGTNPRYEDGKEWSLKEEIEANIWKEIEKFFERLEFEKNNPTKEMKGCHCSLQ